MTGIHFQLPEMLHWLWLLPVLLALILFAARRRQQALHTLIEAGLLERLRISVSPRCRRWKTAALLAGLGFLVFGLARPGWNPQPETVERKGRDVVFLLDVSRSMQAEDLAPNRLERAKLAIRDAVERLEGDRVALVAFAGTAVVKCPLTVDYGFFRMMLERIDTGSVARGGTMIGDALRKTLDEVFDEQTRNFQDVILITDGEDQESFPVEAARTAGERGVRLLAIGLGDENQGRPIPITGEDGRTTYLEYEGERVLSKLDADTLREMALATPGGRYLNVSTGTLDLGQVYQDLIRSAEQRELESQTATTYDEKFQIFLALAFLCLCVEWLIPERTRTAPAVP